MNINGRMKVKTFKAEFKNGFGLTLRVYDGRSFADDNSTLASIRKGGNKNKVFSPRKNTKVGNLEDKIMDMFGIKVQISGSDDSYLCKNDLTLAIALDKDKAKLSMRSNRIKISSDLNAEGGLKYDDNEDLDDIVQGLLDGEDVDYWVDYLITRYKDGTDIAKDMLKKATFESMKEENISCLLDIAKACVEQLKTKEMAEYAIEESTYFMREGYYCSVYFAYRDTLNDQDAADEFLDNNRDEMIDDNNEYECELYEELSV